MSLCLGIVFCPAATLLTKQDIDWRLHKASVTAVIADVENAVKIDEVSMLPLVKAMCNYSGMNVVNMLSVCH